MNRQQILNAIASLDLHGWGGACGAAAIVINHAVFSGKATYVAGVNEYMLESGRPIGHVALKYRGRYYDSDGEIYEDDLLGWGILDAEEYAFPSGAEELAEEAVLVELTEDEVNKYFPWCAAIPRKGRFPQPT